MNKLLIAIALCLPSLSTMAASEKTTDSEWFRSSSDYYRYYSTHDEAYKVQGLMQLIDYSTETGEPLKSIDFRLVWDNEKFCNTNSDKEGVITKDTYYVNDEAVNFSITCYQNKTVNAYPSTSEGLNLVLQVFDKAKSKNVVFVKQVQEGEDVIYKIPSANFSDFYQELKKASKKAL